MIFLNSLIAMVADLGVRLCILIAVWMVNSKLGATTLGLYTIMNVADFLIKREYNKKMKELLEQSEKL